MTVPGLRRSSRKATYASAARMTQLIEILRQSPYGLTYSALEQRLGVGKRTIQRYIEVCRDLPGQRVEVVARGERRVVRLADASEAPRGTTFELFSFFLSLRLGHLLDGTVVGDMNETFWERLQERLPTESAKQLAHIDRKLYSRPAMPRDYREKDDLVDAVLKAVVDQVRLRIDYHGVAGEGRAHEFDPYSLVEHKGGLYLLGKSHLDSKIIWLAIERIRSVETVRNEVGKPLKFAYPASFDPARHTDGMFGVYDGKKVRVELALQNEATESYLRARRIHDTQRFFQGTDGRTHLELTVRGTHELMNWLMATSPWVEVLSPAELREEIAERLRRSAATYAPARRPARAEAAPRPTRSSPAASTRSA